MAKRKKPEAAEIEDALPIPIESSPSDPSGDDKKKKRTGYFIPLTEDGLIDVTRLRGDNERIEAVRHALNMQGGGSVVAPALQINPEFAGYLYDGVSQIAQFLGKRFLHWPDDFAVLVRYDDEAKKKLTPPTTAVLERMAPMWLAKNQDIAMLLTALATETQRVIMKAGEEYARTHPQAAVKANGAAEPVSERPQ